MLWTASAGFLFIIKLFFFFSSKNTMYLKDFLIIINTKIDITIRNNYAIPQIHLT